MLIPTLVVIETVLLRIWSWRRTQRTGAVAIAGLIAIPVLVFIQAIVVTDAEAIRRVCRQMADAVAKGDVDAVADCLSDRFRIEDGDRIWDKSAVVERIRGVLSERWDVEEQRLSAFKISVAHQRATATFKATCRLITSEMMIPHHESFWRLTMVAEEGTWRAERIEPVRTRWFPYDSLADVLR